MEQNINTAVNFCIGGLAALGEAYDNGINTLKSSASRFIATGEKENHEAAIKVRGLAGNVSKFLNFGEKTYPKVEKRA